MLFYAVHMYLLRRDKYIFDTYHACYFVENEYIFILCNIVYSYISSIYVGLVLLGPGLYLLSYIVNIRNKNETSSDH